MPFVTSYIAYHTAADPALTVAGKLRVPDLVEVPAGGAPAMLVCHGSGGVDPRGEFYIGALNAAGIATLEIDMWAARGIVRGAAGRARSVPETLPDAFGALAFLRAQPEIDPARIGIMGFSWGGVVTLLSATKRVSEPMRGDGPGFAAHAAFYPVCWTYNVAPGMELDDLTGAPVLIQCGSADAYDDPDGLDQLMGRLSPQTRALMRPITYPGATHAFDRDAPEVIVTDPFSHKGAGGQVRFAFDRAAAEAARGELLAFLNTALAPKA
jgi:dienelactone hydrolase